MKGSHKHTRGARGRHPPGGNSAPRAPRIAPGGGGAGAQHPLSEENATSVLADLFSKFLKCEAGIGILAGIIFISCVVAIVYTVVPRVKKNGQDMPLITTTNFDGSHTTQAPSNILATTTIVSQMPRVKKNGQDMPLITTTNFDGSHTTQAPSNILATTTTVSQRNASGPQSSSEPCPDDWMYFRKYCYFFQENDTDWSSANSSCGDRKALLAIFIDRQDMDYIMKRAGKSGHWIGLFKRTEGYAWVNGDSVDESSFTLDGDGDCGYIKQKNGLRITLTTCSLPMSSICRMEPYAGRGV